MMRRTLLDTDIFPELMRGKNEVVRARANAYLKQHDRLTISTITILEVEIIPLGREEAIVGGRIYGDLERLGQPIGRAAPMIAGIALSHGLVLATGNDDHYARIRATGYELALDNWRFAASKAPSL